MNITREIHEFRFIFYITLIISLGVNIVANLLFMQQYVFAILLLSINIFLTLLLIYKTKKIIPQFQKDLKSQIIIDSTNGELTFFPNNSVQCFLRQTVNEVNKYDKNLKTNIINSITESYNNNSENHILSDIAEVLILSQIHNTLFTLPSELMDLTFIKNSPKEFEGNNIVNAIMNSKKYRSILTSEQIDYQIIIGDFTAYSYLSNGSLKITKIQNNFNGKIELENKNLHIAINYEISGIWPVNSIRDRIFYIEINGIPIEKKGYPKNRNTLLSLVIVSLSYEIKIFLKHQFSLILRSIFNNDKELQKYIKFSEHFLANVNKIHLAGSIDNNIDIPSEHSFYEQKFLSETLIELDRFLKNNQTNNQKKENLDMEH